MKLRIFRKTLLLLLAMAVLFSAAGCGKQVAGSAREMRYGYIVDVNEQARTVTIDEVEMVRDTDGERMTQLGIASDNFRNGYYAYNSVVGRTMYPLHSNVGFNWYDGTTQNSGAVSTPTGNERTTMEPNSIPDGENLYDAGSVTGLQNGTGIPDGYVLDGNSYGNGTVNNNGAVNNNGTANYNGIDGYADPGVNNGLTNGTNSVDGTNGTDTGNYATTPISGYDTAWDTSATGDYTWGRDFARIREDMGNGSKTLFCFTVDNGVITSIEDCSGWYSQR